MAEITLTETELAQTFAGIESNIIKGFEGVKNYIEAKTALDNKALEEKIETGDKELKDALDIDVEALKALKTILDSWDGTEDGALDLGEIRIEIQKSLDAQGNRLTVTEGDIAKIFEQLKAETDARVKQGADLKTAIDKVIADGAEMLKTFETKLTGVLERLSVVENGLNTIVGLVQKGNDSLKTAFGNVETKVVEMFQVPTA